MPTHSTRRLLMAATGVGGLLAAMLGAQPAAAAGGGCVGPAAGRFATVQAAVDAAAPGGTIRIAPGTYAGGVRIAKSLTIVGAGSGRTTVRGGDSVMTVLTSPGSRPTVVLADLALKGGVARGEDGVNAFGGGLYVRGDEDRLGADVTLRRVLVADNRVLPRTTSSSPSGVACPGGVDCPYAGARGGGIASFGNLVLDHTVVRDNLAGGVASDAEGGGVFASRGSTTVLDSTISGNRAEPKRIARYAEGAGMFLDSSDGTTFTLKGSTVSSNSASFTSTLPVTASDADGTPTDVIERAANGGGIHVGDGLDVHVDRTAITGNRLRVTAANGEAVAFDSGMFVGESALTMRHTTVAHNSLSVVTKTQQDLGFSGTALEVDNTAHISDTVVADNTATEFGTDDAAASNGFAALDFSGDPKPVTVERMVISGNTATAVSRNGSASVYGAGLVNSGNLTVKDSIVKGNRGTATGPDPLAEGGGVWNGVLFDPIPVSLALQRVLVTGNVVTAPGGTARGGGVYTSTTDGSVLVRDHTTIVGNRPDQCSGCSGAAPASEAAKSAVGSAPSAGVARAATVGTRALAVAQ